MFGHQVGFSRHDRLFFAPSSYFRSGGAFAAGQVALRSQEWYVVTWHGKHIDADKHFPGNPALIHPFLTEIGKESRSSIDGDLNTGAAVLHLAIRCAPGVCFTVRSKVPI